MLCGGPLSKVAFAVGGLLPKVYFGVPRPVPARGSKGLQQGETGLRGAVCFCASTGVGAQTNCCAYDGLRARLLRRSEV